MSFTIKKIFSFIFVVALATPLYLSAQEWEVPPDKASETSPVVFDEAFRNNGAELYKKHCRSCHGDPSQNNPAALNPSPGDPASEIFKQETDGALFFKITNGRGLMPRFAQVLNEEERWQVVAYIRSYHEGYVQPEINIDIAAGANKVRLKLTSSDAQTLKVMAYTTSQKDTIPVEKIKLELFIKRYFGLLPYGDSRTTDVHGKTTFNLSDSLHADTSGLITFVVKTADNNAEASVTIETGIRNTIPPLNAERAIWNTIQKAPIWLLLAYGLVVIAVWAVLGYIVLQLFKMYKNRNTETNIETHTN